MHDQTSFQVFSPDELNGIAAALLSSYPDARVFAFFGAMGIGKTTFIAAICTLLGSKDVVSSPTYSVVNQYETYSGEILYHFDLYRVEDLDELYGIGYEEYFYSGRYCFIEWPERAKELLPDGCIAVNMEEVSGHRVIRF